MFTLEMPLYPTKVKMTEGRRAKYYTKGGKIPKKYLTSKGEPKEGYGFKKNGLKSCLFDFVNKKWVLQNEGTKNKPRYQSINNQILYSGGQGSEFTRLKIVNCLKDYFRPFVQGIDKDALMAYVRGQRVIISIYLYNAPHARFDEDNSGFLYRKTFNDMLVREGILQDDNFTIIAGGVGKFIPIGDTEERVMIVKIITEKDFDNAINQIK